MRTYDLTLQNKASNPTTTLNLMLALDKEGKKAWLERRVPPLIPGQRTGDVGPSSRDPIDDLVWAQDDFSAGAGNPFWFPGLTGYAKGTADARHRGLLAPGIARNYGSHHGNDTEPIGVIIPSLHCEEPAAKTPWTNVAGANGTVTFSSTANPRTVIMGNQAVRIVATAAGNMIEFAVANPTVYRSKAISFSAYISRSAGAGGCRVHIADNVATTNGTTITSQGYTVSTATRTIDAAATSVTFRVETTGAGTFDVDDFSVYSGTDLTAGKIAVLDSNIYTYFGRIVCQLRTGTVDKYVWDAVYIHADTSATDIVAFGDNVYVAFGASKDYIYGATTSWTVAAGGVGNANRAVHFVASRNTLWKSEAVNTLKSSTANPETGSAWSTAYTVGADDRVINALFDINDTLLVGKEDGLWQYLRVYMDGANADLFVNVTNEFKTFPNTGHFSIGSEHLGWLYLNSGTIGMSRVNNSKIEDVTPLVNSALTGISGKVRAVASDLATLWLIVGDRLLSVEDKFGHLVSHTHTGPSTSLDSNVIFGLVNTNTGPQGPNRNYDAVGHTYDKAGTNYDGLSMTVTEVSQTGGISWTNINNARAEDNTYATAALPSSGSISNIIRATTINLGVPTTATVTGIKVVINGSKTDIGTPYITGAQLTVNSTAVGVAKTSSTALGTSDADITLGSSTDTWGAALTPTDVNGTGFGVQFYVQETTSTSTARIDSIYVTVYFDAQSEVSDIVFPRAAASVWWAVSGTRTPFLLANSSGTSSSIPHAHTDVWSLPLNFVTNVLDTADAPVLASTSYIETSRYHGGLPGIPKAALYLVVALDEMDGTQPVNVKFGINGQPASLNTLGTLSGSSAVQTLYFDSLSDPTNIAVYNDIALRFEFGTVTGSKNKRRVRWFELHSQLAPERVKEWEVNITVGNVTLNNGQLEPVPKAQVLSALDTLETQAYPIRMIEDFDNDDSATTTAVRIVPGSRARVPELEQSQPAGTEVHRFVLRAVKVS